MTIKAAGIMMMAYLVACLLGSDARKISPPPASWDRRTAAAYLDEREVWWMNWTVAARDHQTFCVSCHTVLPYALSRPALHSALGEQSSTVNEQKLIANVTTRVRLWKEVEPWYSDQRVGLHKANESRATESILNALILSDHDAQAGTLDADAELAFDNMWALEKQAGEEKGSWDWYQFNNEPWEAAESRYYGTALAAIAVGTAPQNYRSAPEIQNNIAILREYLSKEGGKQSPFNRVMLLWASAKLPGLLKPEAKKAIVQEILGKQEPDGGWSLTALIGPWKRHDGTPLETSSDGYATGLALYALEQVGITRKNAQMNRGLTWLADNQDHRDGRWLAYSLNLSRDISSDAGPFMNDAATAYAVLALSQAK